MLLLSEALPLRSTKALGDYSDDTPLPIIFGDLTAAPFPLDRLTERRYVVADHPCEVTKVFTDKQRVFNWSVGLESDTLGHTVTVVTFTSPVPQATVVSACGRGMLDPVTGELIENPGAVLAMISTLAGRDDDWSGFHAECSGKDLRIAGRFDKRDTVKTVIDAVAQSVGAMVWHGGARLYPTADDPAPILDLLVSEVAGLKAVANLTDTADVLRLSYDWSDASQRSLKYIELTASPLRYGTALKPVVSEVVYPYLRLPTNAEAIGRPVLQRLAGERYAVTFTSTNVTIKPGMWVRPVAHPEWMVPGDDPVIMVLQADIDRDNNSVAVTGETIIGQSIVTVTAHSIALPDEVQAAVDVSVQDGIATFTFTDSDGRPIAGAHVSLDGGQARTTDAQGKVRFPVNVVAGEPVDHLLAFEAPGFAPFVVKVPL